MRVKWISSTVQAASSGESWLSTASAWKKHTALLLTFHWPNQRIWGCWVNTSCLCHREPAKEEAKGKDTASSASRWTGEGGEGKRTTIQAGGWEVGRDSVITQVPWTPKSSAGGGAPFLLSRMLLSRNEPTLPNSLAKTRNSCYLGLGLLMTGFGLN